MGDYEEGKQGLFIWEEASEEEIMQSFEDFLDLQVVEIVL